MYDIQCLTNLSKFDEELDQFDVLKSTYENLYISISNH